MKHFYAAPTVELFPLESTATLCGSTGGDATLGNYGEGGGFTPSATSTYGAGTYNSASSSELEDMINDILTY